MLVGRFLPLLAMFSSLTRAFLPTTTRQIPRVACYLSSETPDTSVVELCRQKIEKTLKAESVRVDGAHDDPNGSHIAIQVVSEMFAGKRPIQRQQMVYKAIWEELKGNDAPVHAVDFMMCQTPEEAANTDK